MNNFPDPLHGREDDSEAGSRVSVDVYILLAVSAVMLVTAIVHMVSLFKDSALVSPMHSLLIVVMLCCVIIACWRSTTARNSTQGRSVAMSAALGSFMSGIITVLVSDASFFGSVVAIIAILLIVAALCIIAIIFLLLKDMKIEKTVQPSPAEPPVLRSRDSFDEQRRRMSVRSSEAETAEIHRQSVPKPEYASSNYQPDPSESSFPIIYSQEGKSATSREPVAPILSSASPPVPITLPRPGEALNIIPTDTSSWPPLFEGDELYKMPRTGSEFFIRTKSNDMQENCEDAYARSNDETLYALCDGVSTSKFARPWARLLTLQWVKQPLTMHSPEEVDEWLSEPRKRLQDWVNETWLLKINERNRSMGRIEFTLADAKKLIAQGAAATFLGVTLDKAKYTWSAIIVGDTCLFHFSTSKGEWDYKGYPFKAASEFSDNPASITSRPNTAPIVASNILPFAADYKPGDMLIIATDALAEWLYTKLEQKQLPNIITLLESMSDEKFAKFVNQERAQKQMKDDDTSLVIIRL